MCAITLRTRIHSSGSFWLALIFCRMVANAKRTNASDEYVAVTSIPIADQITRELLPPTGRRQLVGDPFRRRVRCDAKPQGEATKACKFVGIFSLPVA